MSPNWLQDQSIKISLNQETDVIAEGSELHFSVTYQPSFQDNLILHALGVKWDGDERIEEKKEEEHQQDEIKFEEGAWYRLRELVEWQRQQDLKRRNQ